MPEVSVAIIGAGIGGVYLAAELGLLGCKLRLHDRDAALADGDAEAAIRLRGTLTGDAPTPAFAVIIAKPPGSSLAVAGAALGGRFQNGAYAALRCVIGGPERRNI